MEAEELFAGTEDNNEPIKKKESPLISLEKDLVIYAESMREVAQEILLEGLSNTPLFVAHQHQVKLGVLILDRTELNTNWSIHASTIEEFIEKGVIQANKKEHFLKQYKDPQTFMCIFVVVPEGANFVFFPYP